MASSLWAGGTNTTEGPDNSRISTKGTGFAGIGGTGGASMIVFGTIAGGAGAALTGGNFWQGAATGLIVSGLNHAMHQMGRNDPPNKYKRYFASKLEEIKNGYNGFVKPILRSTFNKMEIIGGTAEAVGLMAAPFTGGASLPLASIGYQVSLYGTLGNTALDFIDGDINGGVYRLAKFALSAGMGKALNAIPFKTFVNMANGYKTLLETYVVPVIEDSWNKFNPPSNKLKL